MRAGGFPPGVRGFARCQPGDFRWRCGYPSGADVRRRISAEDGARDTQQHGENTGHLPASNANVALVTCKYNGVHVVDVRNPVAPKEVAFIGSKEGSYPGEGIQALHVDTPEFAGDILVSNNETYKATAGFGGAKIVGTQLQEVGHTSMSAATTSGACRSSSTLARSTSPRATWTTGSTSSATPGTKPRFTEGAGIPAP